MTESPARTTYPIGRAVVLSLAAGVPGLLTLLFDFPGFAFSLSTIAWKVLMVGVMVAALRRFEGRTVDTESAGIVPVRMRARRDRTLVALLGISAMLALTFTWDRIPGLRSLSAAGDPESYAPSAELTGALLAFELIVRYPIGVVVEESFFRGFLQPRLAVAAPVVSGILFAMFHLQQWETIPSLIPFGIALGLLRWWLGSIWPGVLFHYAGNALFILSFES